MLLIIRLIVPPVRFRHALANDVNLTFTATVLHICNGIRKLSAIATKEDLRNPLYRGVRGHVREAEAIREACDHIREWVCHMRKTAGWCETAVDRHHQPPSSAALLPSAVLTVPRLRPCSLQIPTEHFIPDEMGMVCMTESAFMSTSRTIKTPLSYLSDFPGRNVLWELHPTAETDDGFHFGADLSSLSQFAAEEEVLFPPATLLAVKEAGLSSHFSAEQRESTGEFDKSSRSSRHSLMNEILPHARAAAGG